MSKRIVVCDDDSHIVLAVNMKLSKAGFDLVSAPFAQRDQHKMKAKTLVTS